MLTMKILALIFRKILAVAPSHKMKAYSFFNILHVNCSYMFAALCVDSFQTHAIPSIHYADIEM